MQNVVTKLTMFGKNKKTEKKIFNLSKDLQLFLKLKQILSYLNMAPLVFKCKVLPGWSQN